MTYDLDTCLLFGKYKGYTIQEIIKKDPEYLAWAIDEIDGFELTNEADIVLDDAIYEAIADEW